MKKKTHSPKATTVKRKRKCSIRGCKNPYKGRCFCDQHLRIHRYKTDPVYREKCLDRHREWIQRNYKKYKEDQRIYYYKNKIKIQKRQKKYYELHYKEISDRGKSRYEKKKKEILQKNRAYYFRNKNKISRHRKIYLEKNSDKIKEKRRKSYQLKKQLLGREFLDLINRRGRESYQRNKENINKRRRDVYQKNKNKIRKQKNKHYKKYYNQSRVNPQVLLAERVRKLARYQLKRYQKYRNLSKLPTSPVKELGCTPQKFVGYIESKFKNGMSWENYGEWHLDHILPLSSFNLRKKIDCKRAFHYKNYQPLWAKENLQKSDRINKK